MFFYIRPQLYYFLIFQYKTCTIDKTIPYEVKSNGTYTFTVTGTYGTKEITKEILQRENLYNINVKKEANNTEGLNFTFGGFTYKGDTANAEAIKDGTVITSRNQSVAPQSGLGTPKYDGWQILEIKDSSGNIVKDESEIDSKLENMENEKVYVTKLVHAGSPENFTYYSNYKDNTSYEAMYILSSGLKYTNYNTYNPRNWQMYVDDSQKDLIEDTVDKDGNVVKDIHSIRGNDLTNSYWESPEVYITKTGACYWLNDGHGSSSASLMFVNEYGGYTYTAQWGVLGIRPVVALKSGVYIEKGTGTEEDRYILKME